MKPQKTIKKERKYFIDWVRILLILSVFLYHIGMFFNTSSWHVKNNEQVTWLNYIMWFLHLWRMPLLFLVSGVGTYYALGFRTTKQYLGERTKRIFLPLVVGIFTLVPIQVYLEKIDNYSSLLSFYPQMFDGIYPEGNFSWHHLWFLVYLFVIALIISPFLNYLRSERFNGNRQDLINMSSKKLGLNWFIVILVASQAFLRTYFPDQTNALYNDWAYFTYYLLFFLAGFILITDNGLVTAIMNQRRLYLGQTILFTIVMFSLASFKLSGAMRDWSYGITEIIVAWSCGMSALGYGRKYLNFNSNFRKIANEAIYPFYLVHQPVILLIGYYLSPIEMNVVLKMVILLVTSFITSVALYWLLIKRFNFTRIIFGLKPKDDKAKLKLKLTS